MGVRVSLEPKPTDPAARFSLFPSTAAALAMAQAVNRPNFGLTLDVGHCLFSGENPAQSVALVASHGLLFGLHLNDAHSRLGAEDGLLFGSVHRTAALELVYWLRYKVRYSGTVYFDTFPAKEDPVREAELNIAHFQALWAEAERLHARGIESCMQGHDGLCALEKGLGL